MHYALEIGWRHLQARKSQNVRVITFVAIAGVALGVASLLSVIAITSGFQREFQNKVLGVNAHVLILKYGLDFEEYRDVVARTLEMPEVAGAAPFVIHEMMLTNGDRVGGVLVKGVDPERLASVLDLPSQMVEGTLDGLRLANARPPERASASERPSHGGLDLDGYLQAVDRAYREHGDAPAQPALDGRREELAPREDGVPTPPPSEALDEDAAGEAGTDDAGSDDAPIEFPTVVVPTPEAVEAALAGRTTETSSEPAPSGPDIADDAPIVPTEALPGLVVGRSLATQLDIEVGTRVRVTSPLAGLDTSYFHTEARTPRAREFRVIGIFEAGFQEYDTRLVYADLYEAQAFFDHGDSVEGVEIRLHDPAVAPDIARRLERELGGGPYHTMDWQELNHNLFTALEIQKVMLSLVIATIVFLAAFNVMATLITIVLERKREIAILKAMGALEWHILSIFTIQGLAIGLAGTAIGLFVGVGVCHYLETYRFPLDPRVYLIDHLPVQSSSFEMVVTFVIAISICVTATLAPSWWAAKLLPAEGVRRD